MKAQSTFFILGLCFSVYFQTGVHKLYYLDIEVPTLELNTEWECKSKPIKIYSCKLFPYKTQYNIQPVK